MEVCHWWVSFSSFYLPTHFFVFTSWKLNNILLVLGTLFIKMGLICANKTQIKQTWHNIHSCELVKWKHLPLHCTISLHRKDSLSQTSRQGAQIWEGATSARFHIPVGSGNGFKTSCPLACKFSCKISKGMIQACLRVSIITFSRAIGTQKRYEIQQLSIRQFFSKISPMHPLNT